MTNRLSETVAISNEWNHATLTLDPHGIVLSIDYPGVEEPIDEAFDQVNSLVRPGTVQGVFGCAEGRSFSSPFRCTVAIREMAASRLTTFKNMPDGTDIMFWHWTYRAQSFYDLIQSSFLVSVVFGHDDCDKFDYPGVMECMAHFARSSFSDQCEYLKSPTWLNSCSYLLYTKQDADKADLFYRHH